MRDDSGPALRQVQPGFLCIWLPADLKQALAQLARLRFRTITAEATLAIRRYVEQEEKKEGIKPPPPPSAEEQS